MANAVAGQEKKSIELCLDLIRACLTSDFTGTMSDESSDDSANIYVHIRILF
jgi:hypothetical protein